MESLKHKYAKEAVAQWLRDPEFRFGSVDRESVFCEYPVCIDAENRLIGVQPPWPKIPTYEECIQSGVLPLVIFDVVALYKRDGEPENLRAPIAAAFEIVYKNPVSPEKMAFIQRIWKTSVFELHVLDADYVLAQCGPPKRLEHITYWQIHR